MKVPVVNARVAWGLAVLAIAFGLGIFTTFEHVLGQGLTYFLSHGEQFQRNRAVLEGHAGSPWQYRVLAPYLVNGVIGLFAQWRVPFHVLVAFVSFRVLQDTVVLFLACVYYRALGLSRPSSLMGMALLAWGMSYSHYDSDLQFNTFFDITFYLLAGWCLIRGKIRWIIPITIVAAFNRETSGLIPILLLAFAVMAMPRGSWRRVLPIVILALACYASIYLGLRSWYGPQVILTAYGHRPGLDFLQYNLFRPITWHYLVATFSVVPVVAMMGYRLWPPALRAFFWAIVPAWGAIHLVGAVMAETRVLLVPQALVFIPGALWLLGSSAAPVSPPPTRVETCQAP